MMIPTMILNLINNLLMFKLLKKYPDAWKKSFFHMPKAAFVITIILAVIGLNDLENGLNIVGSHIDSPRLDLKATPFYEDGELCLLDTHYYGGIKKYQWTATPLAIHGIVYKKDEKRHPFLWG